MSLEMLLSYAAELPRLPLPRSTPPLDDSSSSTVESPQTIWSSPERAHRSPTFSPVPDFEQGFFIPLEQASETALYTDDGSVILTVRSSTPSRKRKRLQVKRACVGDRAVPTNYADCQYCRPLVRWQTNAVIKDGHVGDACVIES